MGLAITSNPCPTEHGTMGFPTVTHSFAYPPWYAPARALAPARLANLASETLQAISKLARLSRAGIC